MDHRWGGERSIQGVSIGCLLRCIPKVPPLWCCKKCGVVRKVVLSEKRRFKKSGAFRKLVVLEKASGGVNHEI